MILKYKYHSDSGLLEAFRSYTLAQNNSLSDTIVITSTASDAEKYNYCLEFICYNSKSIPKAQYVSPILNYLEDGISFTVPNNLTEFRGHVDMQLTGYDPIDNSIVFKSISKNCKAFDVEGSLCVLEKDLNDTPNVFTEVMKQLEDLRHIHQDIIDEAMRQYGDQLLNKARDIKWHLVKFYDHDTLIEERYLIEGDKLIEPQYTLPENCVIVGGWYNPDAEKLWDMEEDRIEGETKLYLNYMTDDIVISNGEVQSLGKRSNAHIYIPEYFDGYKVDSMSQSAQLYVPIGCRVHICNNLQDVEKFEILIYNEDVGGIYIQDTPELISRDGQLFMKHEGLWFLVFAPVNNGVVKVWEGCDALTYGAIYDKSGLRKIILPKNMMGIGGQSICFTDIEELTVPAAVESINSYAVYNNFKLKRVFLEGDSSDGLTNNAFINEDSQGNITRPTLYVQPQHYAKYKALNFEYEIKIMGQEFFDGKYAPIGE